MSRPQNSNIEKQLSSNHDEKHLKCKQPLEAGTSPNRALMSFFPSMY